MRSVFRVAGFAALVAASLALPSAVGASTSETYTMGGYEVYFGSEHAIFVGGASGSGGPLDLSGWYTSVYHTLSVSPGNVTGGTAFLQRIDGVQIMGDFSGGDVVQTDPGYDCTTETHVVTAHLVNVTRTDEPGFVGTAELTSTLTHYHAWFLGGCYTYSASVDGTITVNV